MQISQGFRFVACPRAGFPFLAVKRAVDFAVDQRSPLLWDRGCCSSVLERAAMLCSRTGSVCCALEDPPADSSRSRQ